MAVFTTTCDARLFDNWHFKKPKKQQEQIETDKAVNNLILPNDTLVNNTDETTTGDDPANLTNRNTTDDGPTNHTTKNTTDDVPANQTTRNTTDDVATNLTTRNTTDGTQKPHTLNNSTDIINSSQSSVINGTSVKNISQDTIANTTDDEISDNATIQSHHKLNLSDFLVNNLTSKKSDLLNDKFFRRKERWFEQSLKKHMHQIIFLRNIEKKEYVDSFEEGGELPLDLLMLMEKSMDIDPYLDHFQKAYRQEFTICLDKVLDDFMMMLKSSEKVNGGFPDTEKMREKLMQQFGYSFHQEQEEIYESLLEKEFLLFDQSLSEYEKDLEENEARELMDPGFLA